MGTGAMVVVAVVVVIVTAGVALSVAAALGGHRRPPQSGQQPLRSAPQDREHGDGIGWSRVPTRRVAVVGASMALVTGLLGGFISTALGASAAGAVSSAAISSGVPVVVVDQSATVIDGQCTTVNVLAGSTRLGSATGATSVAIGTAPTHGTATAHATGLVTYCAPVAVATVTAAASTASFTFTVGRTGAGTSNTGTATVAISGGTCTAGTGSSSGGSAGTLTPCSLSQVLVLPVTPGGLTVSQVGGSSVGHLGGAACAGSTSFGLTHNGRAQVACGVFSPLTVTNATGRDAAWTLTGQTTDFVNPADPGRTCDTLSTRSSRCIPGANLTWIPQAAIASDIVPGDTALVSAGPVVAVVPGLTSAGVPANATGAQLGTVEESFAASVRTWVPGAAANVVATSPIDRPGPTPADPVVGPAPAAGGLHTAPAVLCTAARGHAGGTFVCGACLLLQVPATVVAAGPARGPGTRRPSYDATVTLTLS
ncbi:MAG: hypothetical protein ACYDHU_11425 [Acidimicrobiales bacterium]